MSETTVNTSVSSDTTRTSGGQGRPKPEISTTYISHISYDGSNPISIGKDMTSLTSEKDSTESLDHSKLAEQSHKTSNQRNHASLCKCIQKPDGAVDNQQNHKKSERTKESAAEQSGGPGEKQRSHSSSFDGMTGNDRGTEHYDSCKCSAVVTGNPGTLEDSTIGTNI